MIKDALFHSKILLFGEYGIIQDSMGLSIPYKAYMGELKFPEKDLADKEAAESNSHMVRFFDYIKTLDDKGELLCKMDLDRLKADLDKGMYFDSSIPQGYGVGSSGALVAALYNHYAIDKIDPEENGAKDDIKTLKKIFGQLESYFHGNSSGIDPLICYMKLPVLIKSKNDLGTVGLPSEGNGNGAIFLIDSGMPGHTESMVNIFMERMKQEGFRNMVRSEFKKYNDACISAFLQNDSNSLFDSLKSLSKLVLDNFKPMIPKGFDKIWENGLKTNAYYLKLCGSGGGGFILGFTRDLDKTREMLKGKNLEVIHRF